MTEKKYIKETIVVEGKTDTAKLKALFDVETIETNGSEINEETLNLIALAKQKKGVILFLDPDHQGERIRKIITNRIGSCKQCFINKKDISKASKKIGIAEAYNQSLLKALDEYVIFDQKNNDSLSWYDYNALALDSKEKRLYICNALKISYCNNKQLFKRLNLIGIKKKQLEEILERKEW